MHRTCRLAACDFVAFLACPGLVPLLAAQCGLVPLLAAQCVPGRSDTGPWSCSPPEAATSGQAPAPSFPLPRHPPAGHRTLPRSPFGSAPPLAAAARPPPAPPANAPPPESQNSYGLIEQRQSPTGDACMTQTSVIEQHEADGWRAAAASQAKASYLGKIGLQEEGTRPVKVPSLVM